MKMFSVSLEEIVTTEDGLDLTELESINTAEVRVMHSMFSIFRAHDSGLINKLTRKDMCTLYCSNCHPGHSKSSTS